MFYYIYHTLKNIFLGENVMLFHQHFIWWDLLVLYMVSARTIFLLSGKGSVSLQD